MKTYPIICKRCKIKVISMEKYEGENCPLCDYVLSGKVKPIKSSIKHRGLGYNPYLTNPQLLEVA